MTLYIEAPELFHKSGHIRIFPDSQTGQRKIISDRISRGNGSEGPGDLRCRVHVCVFPRCKPKQPTNLVHMSINGNYQL